MSKQGKRGNSAEYALSESQVQAVLASCIDLTDRVIIGLMLWLGLRESEIAHLNSSWITDEGNIKIPLQQACRCAECSRLRDGMWTPKSRAGARTLPIPKRLRSDLSELLKIKPFGLDISRQAIYYRVKTILKRAGVKFKGLARDTGYPHCLRSTCFNMLVAGGISAVDLCYYAGWRNIAIGSHYIQVAMAKEGALKAGRAIFG